MTNLRGQLKMLTFKPKKQQLLEDIGHNVSEMDSLPSLRGFNKQGIHAQKINGSGTVFNPTKLQTLRNLGKRRRNQTIDCSLNYANETHSYFSPNQVECTQKYRRLQENNSSAKNTANKLNASKTFRQKLASLSNSIRLKTGKNRPQIERQNKRKNLEEQVLSDDSDLAFDNAGLDDLQSSVSICQTRYSTAFLRNLSHDSYKNTFEM